MYLRLRYLSQKQDCHLEVFHIKFRAAKEVISNFKNLQPRNKLVLNPMLIYDAGLTQGIFGQIVSEAMGALNMVNQLSGPHFSKRPIVLRLG